MAAVLLLAVSLVVSGTATAGTTVTNTQARYVGAAAGEWSNPGNVVGPADDNCANMGAVGKANLTSSFGFTIPGGATITGVVAHVKAGEQSEQTIAVQLASNATVDPATTLGSQRNLVVPGVGNGNCASTTFGATTGNDLAGWGLGSLTPATVNNAAFGMVLTKIQTSSIKVDSICLEITYDTADGQGVQEGCFQEPPPETNTITVVKTLVGAAPGSDWSFTGSGDIGGAFTLPAGGGSQAFPDLADDTYTITETTKTGYTASVECFIADQSVATGSSSVDVAVEGGQSATCTFTNTLNTANFTVSKTYDDSATDAVTIHLTCGSGTVTTNDLSASPGNPAVFEVTGYTGDPNCTAVESNVPSGYTTDNSDCVDVPLVADGACTIANTANTGTFTVRKLYSDNNTDPVSVTATCTAPAQVTNNPQSASPSSSAVFNVTQVTQSTTCTATEVVPDGYEADETDCQDGDPIDGGCAITNSPVPRATFRVTKDFTDDNPMGVEVRISCNTGLPLEQSKVITEGEYVEFVVVEYDPGELDCHVDEVVPDGYSDSYLAGFGEVGNADISEDGEGCHFESVFGGDFECAITNTPDPVDVVITKDWIFEGSSDPQGIDTYYKLTLFCDAEIVDGDPIYGLSVEAPASTKGPGCVSVVFSTEENPQLIPPSGWCRVFDGDAPDEFTAEVIPEYPSSHCYVVEQVYDNAVEVDNGCESITVSAGNGAACTVTNTVFFEGIPTLNQYGLALLALLMLGIGVVGFRRYA